MKEVTYEDWQKNPAPRMMWVWDDKVGDKVKRKVIYFLDPKLPYSVLTLTEDKISTEHFRHCAEIEEPKTRRMMNKELSRWLREKPTREYKYSNSIEHRVYSTYTYDEDAEEEEVRKDVVIREDDGEWREPLVEVEE
jgi:hypothetical protein